MTEQQAQQIIESQDRIELKLDLLLAALVEDEDEEPARTLDGDMVPGDRDQSQGLG